VLAGPGIVVRPHHAQRVQVPDVLRALPDRIALGVAQLASESPVLAVAVAAVQLHRVGRSVQPEAREPRLGGGRDGAFAEYLILPDKNLFLVLFCISQLSKQIYFSKWFWILFIPFFKQFLYLINP